MRRPGAPRPPAGRSWLRRWGLVLFVALMLGYLLLTSLGKDCHYNAPLRRRVCSESTD